MVFGREAVQGGEWPMWDPYSFAGFPYAANSQSQLYYPLTWLLWLLPLSGHIQVLAVFNIWVAGVGTYLFTRRLRLSRVAAFVAGLAFTGSGIMQLVIEQWGVSSVYGWLPWVLYASDRALIERHPGWTAAACAAVALQLVAGHVQYAVYTLFVLGVWVLWRMVTPLRERRLRLAGEYALRSVAIVALGVGAALVHLAPLFELSAHSGRAGTRVSSNSPPLYTMLRSLAPEFFGDGGNIGSPLVFNDLWYAGIVTLFLALVAVALRPRAQAWVWAALAGVAVAVAYGIGPFLYARWLPGLSGMLPIRIGYIFVFAVAVLAAFGLDAWIEACKSKPRRAGLILIALVALTGLVLGQANALRLTTSDAALSALQWEQLVRAGAFCVASVLCLAVLVVARRTKLAVQMGAGGASLILVVVLVLDLANAVPGYNKFVRPDEVVPSSAAVRWLLERGGEGRVLGRGTGTEQPVFVPNVQLLYGFPSVAGYDSLHTLDYEDFWAASDPTIARGTSSTPYSNVFVRPQTYTSTAASLLGVRYVASTVPLRETSELTLAYNGEILIYELAPRLPRAFFIARSEIMEREAIVARLGEPDFDPSRAVLLNAAESPPEIYAAELGAGTVRAEIVRAGLNFVDVRVDAPSDGWLVLGDAYYPGWTATVNGRPAPLHTAYLALRAVRVGAGEGLVEFSYTPATFRFSLPVTGTSLLMIALGGVLGGRKRKKEAVDITNVAN
jgi:hypothetical protein